MENALTPAWLRTLKEPARQDLMARYAAALLFLDKELGKDSHKPFESE